MFLKPEKCFDLKVAGSRFEKKVKVFASERNKESLAIQF